MPWWAWLLLGGVIGFVWAFGCLLIWGAMKAGAWEDEERARLRAEEQQKLRVLD